MKSVVIYSGGMDSYTLLNEVLNSGDEVIALSFDYGQRHSKELEYAKTFTENEGIQHHIIALPQLSGSSLTFDSDIPEGHYADETMKSTFVPNRNMIMLAHAVSFAIANGAERVYYGAHAGDHAIYPDCRPEFVQAINVAVNVGNYSKIEIIAPYLNLSKGDILARGKDLHLDYSFSWTCYNGREEACGKCGSCVERLEAFAQNGIIDPLDYEDA